MSIDTHELLTLELRLALALAEIERQVALGPAHHDIIAIDQILRGAWHDTID